MSNMLHPLINKILKNRFIISVLVIMVGICLVYGVFLADSDE
jgi:hypothetical protein